MVERLEKNSSNASVKMVHGPSITIATTLQVHPYTVPDRNEEGDDNELGVSLKGYISY